MSGAIQEEDLVQLDRIIEQYKLPDSINKMNKYDLSCMIKAVLEHERNLINLINKIKNEKIGSARWIYDMEDGLDIRLQFTTCLGKVIIASAGFYSTFLSSEIRHRIRSAREFSGIDTLFHTTRIYDGRNSFKNQPDLISIAKHTLYRKAIEDGYILPPYDQIKDS